MARSSRPLGLWWVPVGLKQTNGNQMNLHFNTLLTHRFGRRCFYCSFISEKRPANRLSTSNSGTESDFDWICESVSSPRPRWVLLLLVQKVTGARRRNKNTGLIGNVNPEPCCSALMKKLKFRRGWDPQEFMHQTCHASGHGIELCALLCAHLLTPVAHIWTLDEIEAVTLCHRIVNTSACEARPWEEGLKKNENPRLDHSLAATRLVFFRKEHTIRVCQTF